MRRSILALSIVLALVVITPGAALAGHKYRIGPVKKRQGVEYRPYTMVGTLPFGHGNAADQAIAAKCTPDGQPARKIRVVYVYRPAGGPQFFQSTIGQISNKEFEVSVDLPNASTRSYEVRIRCAPNLPSETAPSSTANLVTVPGTDPYTMFRTTIPPPAGQVLAFTGRASVPLLLAGVVLLVLGGLLLGFERRLARVG